MGKVLESNGRGRDEKRYDDQEMSDAGMGAAADQMLASLQR